MTEPTATIAESAEKRAHWFSGIFYRKEGYKSVPIKARFHYLGAAFLLISYLAFVFQSPSSPRKNAESSLGASLNIPPVAEVITSALGALHLGSKKEEPKEKAHKKPGKAKAGSAYSGPELVTRPVISIPDGTLAEVTLITGASDGPVRGRVSKNVSLNGEVLLDAGATLVGTGTSTEERLNIRFTRLIFKDGKSQTINAVAYDPEDRLPGIRGSRLGNQATKIAGSIGLNFVGGVSEGLEENTVQSGVGVRASTLKNALLNGASRTAIEESQNLMASLKEQKPVITVPAGKNLLVSFEGNEQ